jgi:hypothetical protein
MVVSAELIFDEARDWLLEVDDSLNEDDIFELPEDKVRKLVDDIYDGGWSAFVKYVKEG